MLRVFASFDCARDADLLTKLIAESHATHSKFTVFDRSTNDYSTPEGVERLRECIQKADALIVLCSDWTHISPNVKAEIAIAQEVGTRYYLVKGRRFQGGSRPSNARISDKMYKWSRGLIDQLVLRNI